MPLHVVNEAKRCLNCKRPMCKEGCPISTAIPEMIQSFLKGDINEAGERLFENNPLSIICSLVCNHENQCEGHCVLNRKGMPVQISSIENYISDNYFDKLTFGPIEKNHKKVGIIGSGPAGITIAICLAKKGYDITVFESKDKLGGVLRYGIPEFRLPRTILDRIEVKMKTLGIKLRYNTSIGTVIGIDEMFRDGYEAIFIGTGVWKPQRLNIKGETLGNVHFAINYLTNPDVYNLGEKLIVIGAGNSAMDVARTALRKGVREVTIVARRSGVSASIREQEYAKADGVSFDFLKTPVEITDKGVIFKNLDPESEGEELLYKADSVIIAISQGPRNRIVSTTFGIEVNEKGLVVTNEEGATTREGVFASGDVVKGAKTVVEAVRYSKQVAESMDKYIKSKKS